MAESITGAETKLFNVALAIFALGLGLILGSIWSRNWPAFAGGVYFCIVGIGLGLIVVDASIERERKER